jgi:hypothetical protein
MNADSAYMQRCLEYDFSLPRVNKLRSEQQQDISSSSQINELIESSMMPKSKRIGTSNSIVHHKRPMSSLSERPVTTTTRVIQQRRPASASAVTRKTIKRKTMNNIEPLITMNETNTITTVTATTVFDRLKAGSMKKQLEVIHAVSNGVPVDPLFLDCDNIVYRFHHFLQKLQTRNQIRNKRRKSNLQQIVKQVVNKTREEKLLRGLYNHRSNISRHHMKALIRNVTPQLFQQETTPTSPANVNRGSLIQLNNDALHNTRAEVNESLRHHRQKLMDIQRLVDGTTSVYEEPDTPEQPDSDIIDQQYKNITIPSPSSMLPSPVITPTSNLGGRKSPFSLSNSWYGGHPTKLNSSDNSTTTAIPPLPRRSQSSRNIKRDRRDETIEYSIGTIRSSLTESTVKFFQPYSPAPSSIIKKSDQILGIHNPISIAASTTAATANTTVSPNSKGSSLVIAFQELILKDVSTNNNTSGNYFNLLEESSIEDNKKKQRKMMKKKKKQKNSNTMVDPMTEFTTTTHRRRIIRKAPLNTGGFKKRNNVIEVGLSPSHHQVN